MNQHTLPGARKTGFIPQHSWMACALQHRALTFPTGEPFPQQVLIPHPNSREIPAYGMVISLDLGNGFAKLCMLNQQSKLHTVSLPVASQQIKKIRHGSGKNIWRVTTEQSTDAFWMGEEAIEGGGSFPVGTTAERFADERYLDFLRATFAQCLLSAGYPSGSYHLVLGLGIRNDEIEIIEEQQVIDPVTVTALGRLKGRFTVECETPDGTVKRWIIHILTIFPAIQSMGTYFAWNFALSGAPAQSEITDVGVIDYGTGDTQFIHGHYLPGKPLLITGEPIGRGMVEIAEGLMDIVQQNYHRKITLAEAQQALISGSVLAGGRKRPLSELLEPLNFRMQNILGRTVPYLQRGDLFLIHTGGGVNLLASAIEERMQVLKRTPEDYLIVPAELASRLNAIGLYAFASVRQRDIVRAMQPGGMAQRVQ